MPRYFFHTGGAVPFRDLEGIEHPNDETAWASALRYTGEVLEDLQGVAPENAIIETVVADSEGAPLFTLRIVGGRVSTPPRPVD